MSKLPVAARLESWIKPQEETLAGNVTLVTHEAASNQVQLRAGLLLIDPGGAGRTVVLPPPYAGNLAGAELDIVNRADAAEDLTIQHPSGTTIVTVSQNESARVVAGSAGWYNLGVGKAT